MHYWKGRLLMLFLFFAIFYSGINYCYYWLDYLQPPEKSISLYFDLMDELLDLEPSSMCGYGQEGIYRDALEKRNGVYHLKERISLLKDKSEINEKEYETINRILEEQEKNLDDRIKEIFEFKSIMEELEAENL